MSSGQRSIALLLRSVRRGFLRLRREGGWAVNFTALLGVVLLTQMMLIAFIAAQRADHRLRTGATVAIGMRETVTDQRAQEFLVALRELSAVTSVGYRTREAALERERESASGLAQFFEQSGGNPFTDTAVATLRDVGAFPALATFLTDHRWQDVIAPASLAAAAAREREIQGALAQGAAAWRLTGALVLLSLIALCAVIAALLRRWVHERREELFVERMAGATESAVLLPLAAEMTMLLLPALLLSAAGVAFLLRFLPHGTLPLL